MYGSHALNTGPKDHGTTGDIVFDSTGSIHSISSLGGLISILKQKDDGTKSLEATYGSVAASGTIDTRIAQVAHNPNDGENLYIAGSSAGTSLTANSATYNIFLHKVKVSDLSTVWTRHWGLDGLNQNDEATGVCVNPDGGKILVTGYTMSYLSSTQVAGVNSQNIFLYFSYQGNLIMAKTYGYNDFTSISGSHIVFESGGEYFYETLTYKSTSSAKQLLFRKVQHWQLNQVWNMTLGTDAGDLTTTRGARLTVDDSFFIVPFDPNANINYKPNPARHYAGLMSLSADTGLVNWMQVYVPSTTYYSVAPVDGDVSPDNLRYYYLVKNKVSGSEFGQILSIKLSDGSFIKQLQFATT